MCGVVHFTTKIYSANSINLLGYDVINNVIWRITFAVSSNFVSTSEFD